MKTSLLIISIFLCSMNMVGQNYMGMSQSKIVRNCGDPDKIEGNIYIYNDLYENGENIYYFDGNGICQSFKIVRDISYLKQYKRMLKSEFIESSDNKYVRKTKKNSLLAELTLEKDKFQIRVQDAKDISLESKQLATNE